MKTLVKVDPIRHIHRWYSVGIQNSLVDGICVVYEWVAKNPHFKNGGYCGFSLEKTEKK